MHHFLDFAPEIIHTIFEQIEPTDLASLAQDHPPETPTDGYWQKALSERVAFQKILDSNHEDVKLASLGPVAETALDLIANPLPNSSSSLNVAFLANGLASPRNRSYFLGRSSLFKHAGDLDVEPASTAAERQLSAKLHCYQGMSMEPSAIQLMEKTAKSVHPYARARVYDLRRYNDHNLWGPFLDDGSQGVDWEKVQSTMIVLGYNLQLLHDRTNGQFSLVWDKPFCGLGDSPRLAYPGTQKVQPAALDEQDPYGVTGTWMRVVCFLDYKHFYEFNFEGREIPADQEREPICREEAIRLIFLKLRVTKIEAPGEDDAPDMPVVHFTGSSRSMHLSWDPNANSRIKGKHRRVLHSVPDRFGIRADMNGVRHGQNDPVGSDPMDQLFHLPRRRAVEE